MDEYKEYFYKKRPFARSLDPGDLEEQKNLRVRLQCKSFHWFMTEVAPDIVKYYPPVLPKPTCSGKVGASPLSSRLFWISHQPSTVNFHYSDDLRRKPSIHFEPGRQLQ